MAGNYRMRLARNAAEWKALFDTVDRPHMVQSWAYGEAKAASGEWEVRRLVFERDSEPVAICQVLDKKIAGIRVASRINRGPLFLGSTAPDVAAVYCLLRSGWRFFIGGVLLVAPALSDNEANRRALREAGFRDRKGKGWCSAWLDLGVDPAQLRKNLASNWRGHLSRAERGGLVLRVSSAPADVNWILGRHGDSMKEKNFSGPSVELLKSLYEAAPEDFVVFQACLADQPVGGLIAFRFGHTAEYYIGWYGPEGRKANAGNFLVWNAVVEMQRRGCRYYDLGGYSSDDKYGHFKQQMNGTEYQLIHEWMAF